MKFVLVGPAYPFRGGIAQYTTSLHRALCREHETLLISFKRQYPDFAFPGRTQRDESHEPFKAAGESILDSLSPLSWRRVGLRACAYAPTAIILQWWQPFFAPAYWEIMKVARKNNIPVFLLCHNIFPHEAEVIPGQATLRKFVIRRVFAGADGFLVHADSMIEQVKQFNREAPVRRIYHPLYDFYHRWDDSPHSGGGAEVPSLLFFGKVRKYKGLETFLRSLSLIRDRLDFKAVVAGEFYLNPERYRKLAHELNLDQRVVWIQRYVPNEEVPRLFRQSDLVVLPYRTATQSGVVPVAYQFAVPVIASDVGGLSEVVLDGRTGFLVPPEDPAALSKMILRYFEENKKVEFQENIREFRKRLTWQQVVDNILGLVKETIAEGEPHPR